MKYENFGSTLKELRKKRGLTQEQLAEYLGISSQAVANGKTTSPTPMYRFFPSWPIIFKSARMSCWGWTPPKERKPSRNCALPQTA